LPFQNFTIIFNSEILHYFFIDLLQTPGPHKWHSMVMVVVYIFAPMSQNQPWNF